MQRLDPLNNMRRLLPSSTRNRCTGESSAEREGILEIVFIYIYVHAFIYLSQILHKQQELKRVQQQE